MSTVIRRGSYNARAAFLLIAIIASAGVTAFGQTTAFTYQGKLADSGTPANGNYDFEFKLFDTPTVGTGTQQGSTVQRLNVSVANGIFTVSLDFGLCPSCFNGADRFLEISVKPTSGGAFMTLSPRQPITATPYALKSVNATTSDGLSVTCVNCVTSSQIQSVAGSQVSGAIPVASVPAGSGNYIQNSLSQQALSNFNISGNGTLGGTLSSNIVNAATQYNLGGSRVLSIAGTNNLFAGAGAGTANTTGSTNSFFGVSAGLSNTGGTGNAFFGAGAGDSSTTGNNNSFFGQGTGQANTNGGSNSFFGETAGFLNTTGFNNSFFGGGAGLSNTTGSNNTAIGVDANVGANNLTFATAIGSGATVSTSSTVVLGRGADTVQVPGGLNVAGTFTASGAGLTNLNASTITLGTLDNARLGVVPIANGGTGSATGSGAGLANLDASAITLGTLNNARLGVVPVANGGTGSATQNFVDVTTAQTIGGNKIFSGTLTANAFNSATQFNINGSRVLSIAGTSNIFAGVGAGPNQYGQLQLVCRHGCGLQQHDGQQQHCSRQRCKRRQRCFDLCHCHRCGSSRWQQRHRRAGQRRGYRESSG